MSVLTLYISDEELSGDKRTGLIAGDQTPASQLSVVTKLRDMLQEIKDGLEAAKTAWDAHDHSGAGKGTPVGTGGGNCFEADAVTNAKLAANAITAAKIQPLQVTEAKLAAASVTPAKVGASTEVSNTISAGGSWTYPNPSGSRDFLWTVLSDSGEYIVPLFTTTGAITLFNTDASPADVTLGVTR
jgi:hypothetical protein